MLSIITVNYNRIEHIKKLWTSLQKYPPSIAYEFIVVDNNYSKLETKKCQKFFRKKSFVRIVTLKTNKGFAGGNHEGVKISQGEIIAFINPDIVLQSECLDILIDQLSNTKLKTLKSIPVGIIAPQLFNPDKTIQYNARKFPTIYDLFYRRIFGKNDKVQKINETQPYSVDWIQGGFLMMKKSFFIKKLKGFDLRFFLFFEDTDLCRRTWELDHSVIIVPQAKAIHGESRLSGHGVIFAICKKTFWVHFWSAYKYFKKYW